MNQKIKKSIKKELATVAFFFPFYVWKCISFSSFLQGMSFCATAWGKFTSAKAKSGLLYFKTVDLKKISLCLMRYSLPTQIRTYLCDVYAYNWWIIWKCWWRLSCLFPNARPQNASSIWSLIYLISGTWLPEQCWGWVPYHKVILQSSQTLIGYSHSFVQLLHYVDTSSI